MKNGYYIDFTTNTIKVTKAFNRRAGISGSGEYDIIMQTRERCPQLRVVIIEAKRKKKTPHDHFTYDKMVAFIACQNDSERLLQDFKTVRTLAGVQRNPYNYVKRWFLSAFPDYWEIPKFGSNEENVLAKEGKWNGVA